MRKWLKKIRESKKMTQSQVAKLAKVSRPLITDIENGNANPSVKSAQAIAKALDFNWTIFFEKSTKKHLNNST
jgi:putative transcriptional regulator